MKRIVRPAFSKMLHLGTYLLKLIGRKPSETPCSIDKFGGLELNLTHTKMTEKKKSGTTGSPKKSYEVLLCVSWGCSCRKLSILIFIFDRQNLEHGIFSWKCSGLPQPTSLHITQSLQKQKKNLAKQRRWHPIQYS